MRCMWRRVTLPADRGFPRAVWCLGFGSYLLGLGTIGYELTGGDSTPGNVGIVDATAPKNIIGFGLCIIFIGVQSS